MTEKPVQVADMLRTRERAWEVPNDEYGRLYTAVAAVKMLHARRDTWVNPFTDDWGPECAHCGGGEWPCATRRLLDGEP